MHARPARARRRHWVDGPFHTPPSQHGPVHSGDIWQGKSRINPLKACAAGSKTARTQYNTAREVRHQKFAVEPLGRSTPRTCCQHIPNSMELAPVCCARQAAQRQQGEPSEHHTAASTHEGSHCVLQIKPVLAFVQAQPLLWDLAQRTRGACTGTGDNSQLSSAHLGVVICWERVVVR